MTQKRFIDFSDPCEAAAAIREALNRAMVEGRPQEVEFQSGSGGSRRVRTEWFSSDDLLKHLARLEAECAAKCGHRASRVLIHSNKGL